MYDNNGNSTNWIHKDVLSSRYVFAAPREMCLLDRILSKPTQLCKPSIYIFQLREHIIFATPEFTLHLTLQPTVLLYYVLYVVSALLRCKRFELHTSKYRSLAHLWAIIPTLHFNLHTIKLHQRTLWHVIPKKHTIVFESLGTGRPCVISLKCELAA